MTMFRFYDQYQDAQQALDMIQANMCVLAADNGYEIVDGEIKGQVDGETDHDAVGINRWADVIEADLTGVIDPGQIMYGFVDPVVLRPDLGSYCMEGVPPGNLIDYDPPIPDEV